jgi:putative ABC transport system substrate-binding protein
MEMRRREFISLVAGGTLAAPFVARAQQPVPVIGVLHGADAKSFAGPIAAFQQGLKEGGFEEGRNIAVEYRWGEGHNERLPELAADLIRRNVAVVVAVGGNASNLAAKRATDKIPIVFNSGTDPVKLGMVTSLSRPEGNITGVTFFASDLVAKQIDVLHQLVPRINVVAVLVNPSSPESQRQPADAQEAARRLGIDLRLVNARSDAEIGQGFESIAQMRADALVVAGDPFFGSRLEEIVGLATRHRIPTMYYRREYVVAGGLMSYGTSVNESYRQVGIYVTRILKGAKPADLPVVQSAKFDFTINLKTAKSLGLEFHPQLLATADEVIE